MSTEAEAIAGLAARASTASSLKLDDGRTFLVIPEGAAVREVSDEHDLKIAKPRYIRQGPTLETRDSLIDYVNRFKKAETVLFANIATDTIVAVIDYHSAAAAEHAAHRATLVLPRSEEWRLWSDISGKLKPQLEFARFIEENAADVRVPSAGELLDACRDLQVRRKVNFIKAVRTATDNENFEYSEETNATGKRGELEIPTKFVLGLPVYFGEPETEVHAFLRWKLDDGALGLGIQLHRVEHIRQAVFKQIVLGVAESTGCAAVFGKL